MTQTRDGTRHLRSDELAARWGLTEKALANQRARGDGPPFLRMSTRHVLYRLEDIEAWEEQHRIARQ